MPYKLKRVGELGEIERFLEEPYNAPKYDTAEEQEEFADEFGEYDEMIRSKLSEFGEIDAFGDAEFSMGDPWGSCRLIGVVVNTEGVYREAVLAALWSGLQTMPLSYLFVLNGTCTTGSYAAGNLEVGSFYILIDKDNEILGYSPDPKVLDAFGFPC